ncbi:MAG: SDR family NAD(P)-dependent oxidoreductase [Rubrobacter sp.]|nr:SDR family NAD(P)-dependent oxidoreductase [Rubrobacter sp.]
MQRHGYGRIVNISSGLGALTDMGGGSPAYRLSKAGLNVLTRILASELRGSGILVNFVCPGWVRTDMGGSSASRSIEEGADLPSGLRLLKTMVPLVASSATDAQCPGKRRAALIQPSYGRMGPGLSVITESTYGRW